MGTQTLRDTASWHVREYEHVCACARARENVSESASESKRQSERARERAPYTG